MQADKEEDAGRYCCRCAGSAHCIVTVLDRTKAKAAASAIGVSDAVASGPGDVGGLCTHGRGEVTHTDSMQTTA